MALGSIVIDISADTFPTISEIMDRHIRATGSPFREVVARAMEFERQMAEVEAITGAALDEVTVMMEQLGHMQAGVAKLDASHMQAAMDRLTAGLISGLPTIRQVMQQRRIERHLTRCAARRERRRKARR